MKQSFVLCAIALLVLSGMGFAAASGLEHGDERATLHIEQPDYIEEDVSVERADNRTIYEVRGPIQRILIEDEDHDDVTDFGILEGSGSLAYDSARDEYVLDAGDEAGTRVVFFDVEREVTREEGNETVTEIETVRQSASLRVSEVNWEHVGADEFSQTQQDAENWSAVASEASRLDPTQPVDETISESFTLFRFWASPLASFFADAQAAVIILTSRPGGLAILGSLIAIMLAMAYGGLRAATRRERQFAEIEDLDETRRDAYLQNARQVLSEADWHAIFPEHHARALRDLLGEDVWLGFKRYMVIRSPTAVKGTLLQAMGVAGFTAEVRRDDKGVPIETRIAEPDDGSGLRPAVDGGLPLPEEGWERVDLGTLDYDEPDDRAIIDGTPADQLEPDVFERHEIGFEDVRFPVTNRNVEDADLIDELDPRLPGDFDDEEQFAEVLERMLHYVVTHGHTDSEGNSRREMDILSFMAELDSLLCDRADFPVWHVERRILLYIADNLDPGEELQDRIEEMEADGIEGGDS